MDTNLTLILSTLFFASIFINLLPMTTSDDTCPYPCYPPPTGTGTPTTTTPPSQSQSQSGALYPPAGYYPSPTGNLPNYPPPSFGNNNFGAPPPPDPILPYFPFYYRKPPHQTEVSSGTSLFPRLTAVIFMTTANVLAFAFIFGFLLM